MKVKKYFKEFKTHTCLENRNLITNFNKNLEPIYKKAIKLYGWDGLYITEDAYWENGMRDETMSALRCNEHKDLSEFWEIFDRVEKHMSYSSWERK